MPPPFTSIVCTFDYNFSVMSSPPSDSTVAGFQSTIDSWRSGQGAPLTAMSWSNAYNTSTKILSIHAQIDNHDYTFATLLQYAYEAVAEKILDTIAGTTPYYENEIYIGDGDCGAD